MEFVPAMRILFLTSCTGDKRFKPDNQLTETDFQLRDKEAFSKREKELSHYSLPAGEMYTGQQHVRLVRGIQSMREACSDLTIDMKIVSAGYGLLDEHTSIAPYEMTFQGMKAPKIRQWADFLDIPQKVRPLFSQYDLIFVALGKEYLKAVKLPPMLESHAVFIFLASEGSQKFIPSGTNIFCLPLGNQDASRLGAGLVALKGRVIELIGEKVQQEGVQFLEKLRTQPQEIEVFVKVFSKSGTPPDSHMRKSTDAALKPEFPTASSNRSSISPVIQIPKSWWGKSHRQKMMYFIPEWDDLVDPLYDFDTDTHPPGCGDGYEHAVYSHQIYDEPQYDGILISKVVVEGKKSKKAALERLGVHRYLRVPREFPILGDCGAFGYILEEHPPYETEEILNYYQSLDFDYGVSIDHLIVNGVLKRTLCYRMGQGGNKDLISLEEYEQLLESGQARELKKQKSQLNLFDQRPVVCKEEVLDEQEKWRRYEITVNNARDFIEKHRKGDFRFTPIGAAQGWSPESYADCVKEYQQMGYTYIALGGLVRTNTTGILEVLQRVNKILKPDVKLHLFGVVRPDALLEMQRLGVASIDSASYLRRAWLGATSNYFTPSASYAAIRIPQSDKSPRAKQIVKEDKATFNEVQAIEGKCLKLLRAYDRGEVEIESVLQAIMQYDDLMGENRKGYEDLFRKTLQDRPWKQCPCKICKKYGIEVIIFRGNNRNRRRGFHNTKVFYDRFCKLFGED